MTGEMAGINPLECGFLCHCQSKTSRKSRGQAHDTQYGIPGSIFGPRAAREHVDHLDPEFRRQPQCPSHNGVVGLGDLLPGVEGVAPDSSEH